VFNSIQPQSGRSFGLTLAIVGIATAGVSLAVSSLSAGNPLGLAWLESSPPSITFRAAPAGFGAKPSTLVISAVDPVAGLARVAVTLSQDGHSYQLAERSFDRSGVGSEEISVDIDPLALQLREGSATVSVSALDRSALRNTATVKRDFQISFAKPRVEPLSVQQNGTVGGAELVVFRYTGRPIASSGVESSKGASYAGYPLAAFDPSKGFPENTYFALFPIPYDFVPTQDTLRLTGTDDFGNSASAGFNYRIAPKSFPQVDMGLSADFFQRKVPELRDALRKLHPAVVPSGDDAKDFKLVNEELRRANEAAIRGVIAEAACSSRMWRGAFVRPLAAAPKASFAEGRRYVLDGSEISRSRHMGVDLADVAQARVVAGNAGRVIFAGDLGIYGGLVIVDHGVGVSSLYGHLSSLSVRKGDAVEQGGEIGRTGATGLAGGDHLHYEIRVQGEPVSPLAWLDERWVSEHIEDKIDSFAVPQATTPQALESPRN